MVDVQTQRLFVKKTSDLNTCTVRILQRWIRRLVRGAAIVGLQALQAACTRSRGSLIPMLPALGIVQQAKAQPSKGPVVMQVDAFADEAFEGESSGGVSDGEKMRPMSCCKTL
jgi:hypothetical protein